MNKSIVCIHQCGDRELFIRHGNGEGATRINTFMPYFYAPWFDVAGEEYEGAAPCDAISFFGDELGKVECKTVKEVIEKRAHYSKTFEADVKFTRRYLIDNYDTPLTCCNLRVCLFDIETLDSIDIENTPAPIVSIVAYDNLDKKYYTFVYSKKHKENKTVKSKDKIIMFFPKERIMLRNFINFIIKKDPDVIAGWNSYGFDFPYIQNRCKLLGLHANRLSPIRKVFHKKVGLRHNFTIGGRVAFDLQQGYKKMQLSLKSSYRLDDICNDEISAEKIKLEHNITWYWQNDIKKLIKYNIRDVKLLVELDKKLNIIQFFDEHRREIGCCWDDLWYAKDIVHTKFLRKAKEKDVILPSGNPDRKKPDKDDPDVPDTHKNHGGYVKESVKALHHNVIVLDFKALYPSWIVTANLSPDTIDKNGEILAPNGVRYTTDRIGFIPEVVKELFDFRDKYKKEWKRLLKLKHPTANSFYLKQYGVKVDQNSMYGVLDWAKFCLYDQRVAASITAFGREMIKWVEEWIHNKTPYKVVGGDTDSVFVAMPADWDVDKCVHFGNKLTRVLNKKIDVMLAEKYGITEHIHEIEFEKLFKSLILLEKKNYIGFLSWEEGYKCDKFKAVGVALKRSDRAIASKNLQKKLIYMIMKDGAKKADVDEYLNQTKKDLITGKLPITDIVLPNSITKSNINKYGRAKKDGKIGYIPGHVMALKHGIKYLGVHPDTRKTRMLYVKHRLFDKIAVGVDEIDKLTKYAIDYDKMYDALFSNIIKQIYSALGWDKKTDGMVNKTLF